jgi:glycosyltransferase involved in cell wall biosynthesis
MMSFSAYIPCYNAEATIRRSVMSVLNQTVAPADVLVVDDGSTDGSIEAIRDLDVRVISLPRNLGRGEARARAMTEATHDLVLCCDATNVLEPAFVEKARSWMADPQVAAVFGRITQAPSTNVAERWRGRHLFKTDLIAHPVRRTSLCTWGTLVRASAVRSVGGYDHRLRHSEDGELGSRLLAANLDVVYDPALTVTSIAPNTLGQVLERHWRWYAGPKEQVSWRGYLSGVAYSAKTMAATDLSARDPLSALVSLFSPHYQFWRSLWRKRLNGRASR